MRRLGQVANGGKVPWPGSRELAGSTGSGLKGSIETDERVLPVETSGEHRTARYCCTVGGLVQGGRPPVVGAPSLYT